VKRCIGTLTAFFAGFELTPLQRTDAINSYYCDVADAEFITVDMFSTDDVLHWTSETFHNYLLSVLTPIYGSYYVRIVLEIIRINASYMLLELF
jgi:hypothetical protein